MNPTTVNKGGEYTFTASKAAEVNNCWNCIYKFDTGASENYYNNSNISVTKTAASNGTKTLEFSCDCDNNTHPTCTTPLTVALTAPSFSCPTNLKANTTGSDNVKITPQNVVGCDEGGSFCHYTITGTSVTGNSYTGGALPAFTESGKSDGATETYEVSLTNSVGTTKHNCDVEFTAGSLCNCETYCGSGCNGHVKTGNINDAAFNGCLFIIDATRLSFTTLCNSGKFLKINGVDAPSSQINCSDNNGKFQPCWDNSADCTNFLNNYTKVDGGWYIYANVDWASVRTTKATTLCTGTGGVNEVDLSIDCNASGAKPTLDDGQDYKVTAIGSCTHIKFDCPYGGGGCSIQVGGNTATTGGDNTQNNNLSPTPSVNDILHVTGDVSKICCAIGW